MESWSKRLFKWPRRILLALWLLFMAASGGVIWHENQTLVDLTFWTYGFEGVSLGTLVCIILIFGFTLGFGTCWFSAYLKVRSHNRRAQRAEKEMERIRSRELVAQKP